MQLGRNYHMGFDTHKHIKALMRQGMQEPQAESIVQIVSDSREFDLSKLATKDQLESVKLVFSQQLDNVKERLVGLEDRVIRLEEKVDEKFVSLEQKIDGVSSSIVANHRWMIGMVVSVITLLATMILRGH